MRTAYVLVALVIASSLSCTHDGPLTLLSPFDDNVLVAEERETMERIIDCAIARVCGDLSVMALLMERKAFLVPCGTTVALQDGFSLSKARKIHVLSGEHAGKEGWVYERMLTATRSSLAVREPEDAATPPGYFNYAGFSSMFLDTYQ